MTVMRLQRCGTLQLSHSQRELDNCTRKESSFIIILDVQKHPEVKVTSTCQLVTKHHKHITSDKSIREIINIFDQVSSFCLSK